MMIVGIHQPNFFPWFGYFLKISKVDTFIFLDDVPIVKTGGSYTNRCKILSNGKEQWLTMPIEKKPGECLINEALIVNGGKENVFNKIKNSYKPCRYYKENIKIFEACFMDTGNNLCSLNIKLLRVVMDLCNIKKKIVTSSSMPTDKKSTERLVHLIQKTNGDTYLSGRGADSYQDVDTFKKNGIKILYNDFESIMYTQYRTEKFVQGLSILDMLFNLGPEMVGKYLEILKIKANNYD